jgi:signal transduction histidine kinase
MGGRMEKEFQINFRMVEGLLVMGLVFFFDPLKRALQEISNYIFFREQQYYRKVFSDISTTISVATHIDLENLLDEVAHTIGRAMKIREVSFVFFSKEQDKLCIRESTLAVSSADIQAVVDYIGSRQLPVLNIYDLSENDTEILRDMKKIKAFTIIPIYHENKLIGILNIGKRRIRHHLLAEEEEMLIMLVNQMVISLENTRLARDKFTLERRIYENEKLSSLGRLSTSIAHEVKNPLSSIKAITQVMKEELPPTDSNQEGLSLIIGEVDRLSRVVTQLLRFARPHSGFLEEVDVNEVIKDVLMLLKHEANRKHVAIETLFSQKTIPLLSDRDALSEIFFNLIHNAIQSLSEGGKVVICTEIVTEKDVIKVSIADNGTGIPSGDREKIFEPFYTTKQTGTGLGLTIVKHRVEKLKGNIAVKDNHPGTIFEVLLPIVHIDKVEIPNTTDVTTEISPYPPPHKSDPRAT